MPIEPNNIVPALIIVYVAWRVLRRVRRNIGRQPVTPKRMMFRIGLYSFLAALFVVISIAFIPGLAGLEGLVGGLALGTGLGLYGVHLTRFETTAEGKFYTPNPYIGVAVSLLLVGRLSYRLLVFSHAGGPQAGQPQVFQSPLTMLVFGLLAGYYITYFAGVLRRSRA